MGISVIILSMIDTISVRLRLKKSVAQTVFALLVLDRLFLLIALTGTLWGMPKAIILGENPSIIHKMPFDS